MSTIPEPTDPVYLSAVTVQSPNNLSCHFFCGAEQREIQLNASIPEQDNATPMVQSLDPVTVIYRETTASPDNASSFYNAHSPMVHSLVEGVQGKCEYFRESKNNQKPRGGIAG